MELPRFFASPDSHGSRRDFLNKVGNGFGMLALAGLLQQEEARAQPTAVNPLLPRASHFTGKAKSVIWLFMNGGPSHVDTWDHKPELERRDGQELTGFDRNTGFF